MAVIKATYRDYWHDDHHPIRNMLVESHSGAEICRADFLSQAFRDEGVVDGDEVIIEVRKTGARPFGQRRVRQRSDGTYKLDE